MDDGIEEGVAGPHRPTGAKAVMIFLFLPGSFSSSLAFASRESTSINNVGRTDQ